MLDRKPHDAVYLAQQCYLTARRNGRLWEFDADSVRAYVAEEAKWTSIQRAADLCGVSIDTIKRAVRRGEIEQRHVTHARPSLLRSSAVAFAERWQRRREDAERRAEAERRRKREHHGPPQDGDVWLSVREAALVLGLSPSAVKNRLAVERLPGVQSPSGQWWLRRGHVEQAAAARALTQSPVSLVEVRLT